MMQTDGATTALMIGGLIDPTNVDPIDMTTDETTGDWTIGDWMIGGPTGDTMIEESTGDRLIEGTTGEMIGGRTAMGSLTGSNVMRYGLLSFASVHAKK